MKIIINCETGEIIERELNKSERDQEIKDQAISEEYGQTKAQKAADKAALLTQLGITEEQAKLLLG
jgi:hypothetical protein